MQQQPITPPAVTLASQSALTSGHAQNILVPFHTDDLIVLTREGVTAFAGETHKMEMIVLLIWGEDALKYAEINVYLAALNLAQNYMTCDEPTREKIFDLSMWVPEDSEEENQ
jgi:hypothetical protein